MPPSTLLPDMMTDEHITYQANQLDVINLNLTKKNLVSFQGITSTNVALVQEGESMQLITAKELDDTPDLLNNTSVKIYRFEAPLYPFESVIRARDIQNLKPIPGSKQTEVEAVEQVVMQRVDRMDRNYALTLEFIIMNMLKGKIMKNASTELVNLYTLLSKTPVAINFELDVETTNVLAKCQELAAKIQDGLKNDVMSGVEVQCSPTFFASLVGHPTVQEAYQNFMGSSQVLIEGVKNNRFFYGGIWFERNATSIGGTPFITAGSAHAYPVGTLDTFEGSYSPADMTAYANTQGQRLYISTHDLKHGKGIEIHMESRPVAFCKRLDALVECTLT